MTKIVTIDSLCNICEKVYVHDNKAAALAWVKDNLKLKGSDSKEGSNDGCSLLVFYRNEYRNIRALPPLNKSAAVNEKLRIIGAQNNVQESFIEKVTDNFVSCKVPRLAGLQGDEIIPDTPHDDILSILIFYEKKEKRVGEFFFKIIDDLKTELVEKVKRSKTNDPDLQIDIRKLMEDTSLLAIQKHNGKSIESDLRSGRIYFIYKTQDEAQDEVIRYTFKMNAANKVEEAFLFAEKNDKRLAKKLQVDTEKTKNHHRLSAFKGYWKVFSLGTMTEMVLLAPLVPILIALHFFPASLPLILVAVTVLGVAITAWTMQKGFKQVAEENRMTIDYGKTTFSEFKSLRFLSFVA